MRHFVQLAHDHTDQYVARQYLSEKLDGMRAFWDGGVSRGLLAREVPYANTIKDDRYIEQEVRATGLWSRGAKVIHAPEWFLNQLPKFCIDGELWIERGKFQELRTIVSHLTPGPDWEKVKYVIFDKPAPPIVFADGEVKVSADIKLSFKGCLDWYIKRKGLVNPEFSITDFHHSLLFLKKNITQSKHFFIHEQIKLPDDEATAKALVDTMLESITEQGGEGLMIRDPWAVWRPERVYSILKIKKLRIGTAIVTGYTTGRRTDKGSKHLGRMGALIVEFEGKRLELSGFTDDERALADTGAYSWACDNPGMDCPDWIYNRLFPRGMEIKFQYRELTDDGIPKEARYLRG